MLKPNEVFENATLKEDENYKFRTYLKILAKIMQNWKEVR